MLYPFSSFYNSNCEMHRGILFVSELYIRKKYRHQGYGKATLDKVEKIAKKLKIKRIGLDVFYHNVIAKKLYSKVGYNVISEYRIKKI